jgi:hypothetical protein
MKLLDQALKFADFVNKPGWKLVEHRAVPSGQGG